MSQVGVTGVRDAIAADIPQAVARIKAHTTLPVVVGFGISTAAQVKEVAAAADGVVVGSVLVNVIRDNLAEKAMIAARLKEKTRLLAAATGR